MHYNTCSFLFELQILTVKFLVLKAAKGNYNLLLGLKNKYKISFMLIYNCNQTLKFIVFCLIKNCVHLKYVQL